GAGQVRVGARDETSARPDIQVTDGNRRLKVRRFVHRFVLARRGRGRQTGADLGEQPQPCSESWQANGRRTIVNAGVLGSLGQSLHGNSEPHLLLISATRLGTFNGPFQDLGRSRMTFLVVPSTSTLWVSTPGSSLSA